MYRVGGDGSAGLDVCGWILPVIVSEPPAGGVGFGTGGRGEGIREMLDREDPNRVDSDHEELEEDNPLVRRLRHLEWPEVPSEVRERCWQDFVRRLDSGEVIAEPSLPEPTPPETRRKPSA